MNTVISGCLELDGTMEVAVSPGENIQQVAGLWE